MTVLPKAEMVSLAHHEVVPGHHLQVSRTLTIQPPLPDFRRFFGDEAFSEGWAVYAEQDLSPKLYNLTAMDRVGLVNYRYVLRNTNVSVSFSGANGNRVKF